MESRKNGPDGSYLQGRNKDTGIENGHVGTTGEEEGGTNWEIRSNIYTLPYVNGQLVGISCIAQGAQRGAL